MQGYQWVFLSERTLWSERHLGCLAVSVVSDRPSNACSLGVIIIGVTRDLLPLGEVMINRCFGFFSSFPSITWTVCSMSDVLRADNQSLFNSFCCSSSYTEPLKHRFSDLCFSVICFAYTALSTPAKLKTVVVPINA